MTRRDYACGGLRARKLLAALEDGGKVKLSIDGSPFFCKKTAGKWTKAPFEPCKSMSAREFVAQVAYSAGVRPEDVIRLSDRDLIAYSREIALDGVPCKP